MADKRTAASTYITYIKLNTALPIRISIPTLNDRM